MFTTPNLADEVAADAPYPVRDVFRPASHAAAVALFRARQDWWLRVAQEYTRQAEHAADAVLDARRALAAAKEWAA